jgi:hypothetical protein
MLLASWSAAGHESGSCRGTFVHQARSLAASEKLYAVNSSIRQIISFASLEQINAPASTPSLWPI